MLHHGRQRHVERPGKIADREGRVRFLQPGKQRAPGRVGERGESAVQCGIVILNHKVKC